MHITRNDLSFVLKIPATENLDPFENLPCDFYLKAAKREKVFYKIEGLTEANFLIALKI